MDVAARLQGLRLERYEQVFREERIEADVLSSLSDLVGSTPLSARLDPEDLREITGVPHRRHFPARDQPIVGLVRHG